MVLAVACAEKDTGCVTDTRCLLFRGNPRTTISSVSNVNCRGVGYSARVDTQDVLDWINGF